MSDAATLVQQQPQSSSTSNASTSQPSDYPQQQQQGQQYQSQAQLSHPQQQQQQQNSNIVYQQSPQQPQLKHNDVNVSYESANNTQNIVQNHSNVNYQHNSLQSNGGSFDSNNNSNLANGGSSGSAGGTNSNSDNNGVTFTTLTTFRTNAPAENNTANDEYVPNGGNMVFGLPTGLLMTASTEDNGLGNANASHPPQQQPQHSLLGSNGLMPAPPPHHPQQPHSVYPQQGMHHPSHFQIPPHFIQNPHQPQPGLQHMLPHISTAESHIIGPGGIMVTPSSSAAPPPGALNHPGANQAAPHHGHFSADNNVPAASSVTNHATPSSSAEDAPDPYLCVWCTFKTIYKGNMKRHLISCHGGITDDLLRRLSFDVDRLRKLCPNRPHLDELPIVPKAPRQSSSHSGEIEGEVGGTKPPKSSKSNGGGAGSGGRKRSTNGTNGNNVGDNGNRGRPRKSAKGDKGIKDDDKACSPPDEVFKNGRASIKQEMHDEVLRQNGASSSSPSSVSARLNSKASASSAAGSPSVMALSSGVATTSLMSPPPPHSMAPTGVFSSGPSLLQAAPPQSMAQLQHSFGDSHQSLMPHAQFGTAPFPHTTQSPLFMVMNPGNGGPPPGAPQLQGAPPQLFNPAGMPHPLMIPHSQTHNQHLQHLQPPSHLQHLDGSLAGLHQQIYYQPLQPTLLPPQHQALPHQQSLMPRIQLGGGQPPASFASLSTFKAPIKECSNDSGISLPSYNTGVDL